MKILHAPHVVAGNAFSLSRAERELGHRSDVLALYRGSYNFPADTLLDLSSRPRWRKRQIILTYLLKAYLTYEVFHFNFGQTLFHWYEKPEKLLSDLIWLRNRGRKVFMTFQGCDVRDRFYCTDAYPISACVECDYHAHCNEENNAEKRRIARLVEAHANHVYVLNPDLVRACPSAEFLPYASVDPRVWTPLPQNNGARHAVRILHSPSSRAIKGTHYVLEAIDELKRRGLDVELMLVENVPWAQVMDYYRQADIVVDQLLVGWYGAFAVECMALGKPVLCYLREQDLTCVSFRDEIPIVRTSPQTLVDDLAALVEDVPRRRELGEQGRAFVETHHNPMRIASKVLEDYARY